MIFITIIKQPERLSKFSLISSVLCPNVLLFAGFLGAPANQLSVIKMFFDSEEARVAVITLVTQRQLRRQRTTNAAEIYKQS